MDENGNAIEVDELGTKDKVMHKSKSKLVNSFKSVSKRVAAIGADVTVDGVRKKVCLSLASSFLKLTSHVAGGNQGRSGRFRRCSQGRR